MASASDVPSLSKETERRPGKRALLEFRLLDNRYLAGGCLWYRLLHNPQLPPLDGRK
ncbi:hypothetical protein D9M69_445370 [compost metagenome]